MWNKILIFFGVAILSLSCSDDEKISPTSKDYHNQNVGVSAADLLKNGTFTSLQIEVVYVTGYELSSTTLNNLTSFLQSRLNKTGGISVSKKEISSPGLNPYSLDDVKMVESNQRSEFNSDSRLAVYVFVSDGDDSENENVLGYAYKNTSICLFGNKIHELSGGIGQPSRSLLETTVLEHEFGHLMGLVNIGTPMQTDHQDNAHGNHCDVDNCLMYWSTETGNVVDNLAGLGTPPTLDSQCLADLKANGGK